VRNTTYIETIFRKYTEIYNGKKSLLTKKKKEPTYTKSYEQVKLASVFVAEHLCIRVK